MQLTQLRELENLIYRARFHDEFLEYDIQNLLTIIFKHGDKLPSKYFDNLKLLLLQVTNLEKSTNFGYFFYELLQENIFPFCEDVLRVSVKTEGCYNLNDKALKSFVITHMISTTWLSQNKSFNLIGSYPKDMAPIFFNILNELANSEKQNPVIPGCNLLEVLFFSLQNDHFPQTQKKASCIISYLNVTEMLPISNRKIATIPKRQ